MAKVVDIGAYSAYAIAKKYGYNGTEAEWVAAQESARVAAETAAENAAKSAERAAQIEASVGAKGAEAVNAVKTQETQSVAAVGAAGNAQVETIRQEGAAQVQAVAQKGAEVLASIPQDYTEAMNTKAPVIVETMKGAICATDIAADAPLHGLTLCGKTTQDGTPSPEAPVPLVSAGEGGSVGVNVTGKNMADIVYSAPTKSQYSTVATIKPFRLYAGVSYVLSFDTPNTGITCYVNNSTFSYKEFVMDGTRKSFTFTVSQDSDMTIVTSSGPTAGSAVLISRGTASSDVESGEISNVQIEIGSAATAFEPYESGGSMTVNTPNGLPGIPVKSGGNYTDEKGQQWICDEIDFERGVYVKRFNTVKLTPELSWAYSTTTNRFWLSVGDFENGAYEYSQFRGRCTHFASYDGMGGGLEPDETIFKVNDSIAGVAIRYNKMGGNVEAFKTFLAENEVYVTSAIQTPIETPIPADELADYRALRTIKPNTTVYNDAGAGMKVDYAADTKLYIDKKISAIAAATVKN